MKKQAVDCKVNLIGEQDLSKFTADELNIIVAEHIKGLQKFLSFQQERRTTENK